MDFYQELKELITAALEAGIKPETIISVLEDQINILAEQEAEEAADKANEDDLF